MVKSPKTKKLSLVKKDKKDKNNKNGNTKKITSKKESQKPFTRLETIKVTTEKDFDNYLPQTSKYEIKPKVWELPNRKRFFDWVLTTFEDKYLNIPKSKNPEAFNPFTIQRLIHDFMRGGSPYRGLLLYYGLGVGKSCSALSISEAINTLSRVIFISKASLEDNFKKEIKFCGAEYMRTMNHWVFSPVTTDAEKKLADKLGITEKMIDVVGGMFLIDYSRNDKPNYFDLPSSTKSRINEQIDMLLNERFTFMHIDDTRLHRKISQEDFDNSVIIIDEVHNVINTMTGGSSRGALFYNFFMNAKNSKFIFLSGTPLINRVYESARLYNILRGYMGYLEFRIKTSYDTIIDYNKIKFDLQKNKYVDQVIINKVKKTIKVTRNPPKFVTSSDKSASGIIYDPEDEMTDEEWNLKIQDIIRKNGYDFFLSEGKDTALPDDEMEFERLFYNSDLNKMKKTDLFKRRIAGLTSYFGYLDPKLFPKVIGPNIEQIPMSDYQLRVYEVERHEEITKEKSKRKKVGTDDQIPSTFRIHSRFACSLVFPEEINIKDKEELLETLESNEEEVEEGKVTKEGEIIQLDITMSDNLATGETIGEAVQISEKERDRMLKSKVLQFFRTNSDKYLNMDNGSLAKFSPKYLKMIQNIVKSPGTALVYSQFITLIGLYTFAIALDQTGEFQQFKIRKVDEMWELEEGFDPKKKSYVFYSGKEDRELRKIYVNIFNSRWNQLDGSCDRLISQLKKYYGEEENLYGKAIRLFMTTRTGAEGLDLKQIRQVHIMEPYWQPVLMDQVIGRAVRTKSHERLPESERNVEVFFYMATISPNQVDSIGYVDVRRDVCKYHNDVLGKFGKVITTDEFVYIISQRKKQIIEECQTLIKESAFDCAIFYDQNIKRPGDENLRCLDYPTTDRSDYLYAPSIVDTEEILELGQEKMVTVQYIKVMIKDGIYYYPSLPDASGNIFLYDESLARKIRLPKPVGKVILTDSGKKFAFFKKKGKNTKNNKK